MWKIAHKCDVKFSLIKSLYNVNQGDYNIGLTLQPVFVSKKLEQDLNLKKPSRQLSISNALFNILYVISAMQIMSAIQPDTFLR